MRSAPNATEVQVAVVGLLAGAIAYVDLVGTDVAPTNVWGHVSMFPFVEIVAFLVPAAALLVVGRHRFADGGLQAAWPLVLSTSALTALASAVMARLVDDAGGLAVAVAIAGSALLLVGAVRARGQRGNGFRSG